MNIRRIILERNLVTGMSVTKALVETEVLNVARESCRRGVSVVSLFLRLT